MFDRPGLVIGWMCVLVCVQLAGMVVMSVRFHAGPMPIPDKPWNWFRRLTWSTVFTSVLLIIVSLMVIRH